MMPGIYKIRPNLERLNHKTLLRKAAMMPRDIVVFPDPLDGAAISIDFNLQTFNPHSPQTQLPQPPL